MTDIDTIPSSDRGAYSYLLKKFSKYNPEIIFQRLPHGNAYKLTMDDPCRKGARYSVVREDIFAFKTPIYDRIRRGLSPGTPKATPCFKNISKEHIQRWQKIAELLHPEVTKVCGKYHIKLIDPSTGEVVKVQGEHFMSAVMAIPAHLRKYYKDTPSPNPQSAPQKKESNKDVSLRTLRSVMTIPRAKTP